MASDNDTGSVIFIGGSAIVISLFLAYNYYKKYRVPSPQTITPTTPFPGNLEGQIINQGERPFGARPDIDSIDPFGIKFNDPTSENFHIQNNRTRAIAMAYRYVTEMSWLPVDPIGTRAALDELARIKNQNSSCATTIYDNMQILIFHRGSLLAEEEDDIAITIAKAYLKLKSFQPHPGIPINHVC